MGEHVQHLRVGQFADEEWYYFCFSPLLEGVLKSIKHLRSLTWSTHHAVRPEAIALLHKAHPSAKLHISYHHRHLTPLSRTLLSSPQLHTLDIALLRAYPEHHNPEYNELQFIKECVGPSLRIVRFKSCSLYDYQTRHFAQWESVKSGPMQFDWQEGDRWGPLEELFLQDDLFELTLENCDLWARVTSWDQLQRLDLDVGAPRWFFASLTDRAVNLKYLKFWVAHGRNSESDLHPLEIGLPIYTRFLSSIKALRELQFGALYTPDFEAVLSASLGNTGESLRRLTIQCNCFDLQWTEETYISIFDQAPRLEFLKASIQHNTVEGSWKGSESCLSPQEKYRTANKDLQDP